MSQVTRTKHARIAPPKTVYVVVKNANETGFPADSIIAVFESEASAQEFLDWSGWRHHAIVQAHTVVSVRNNTR